MTSPINGITSLEAPQSPSAEPSISLIAGVTVGVSYLDPSRNLLKLGYNAGADFEISPKNSIGFTTGPELGININGNGGTLGVTSSIIDKFTLQENLRGKTMLICGITMGIGTAWGDFGDYLRFAGTAGVRHEFLGGKNTNIYIGTNAASGIIAIPQVPELSALTYDANLEAGLRAHQGDESIPE